MPLRAGKHMSSARSEGTAYKSNASEETSRSVLPLESLLEAVADAVLVVDQTGLIQFVNRRTELIFGFDRHDLVGKTIESLVPEAFQKTQSALREGYFENPEDRSMGLRLELSGRHGDGTEFPVEVNPSPVDIPGGRLVIATVRDLTDRIRAEQSLRRSDQLVAIVDNTDDAIVGKTLHGTIASWNPAAERMYGYSGEEVIGKSVELLSPCDRAEEMNAILATIGEGRHVGRLETTRVRKDGKTFPVSLTIAPIRDEHGAIVGVSTITRDVTNEQKAFEASRSMIESSLDSLVSINPEGKITDVNAATVKVTGVPREGLIGTAFSDYFTDPEKANRVYQLVFAEGMARDYPLTMRHRDGSLTDVLYNASVYRDSGGNVLGVFAAARDVTKQKQAQREIAEQQGRELGRLAELERFQRLTVGRELKMIELKKEIEYLRRRVDRDGGKSEDDN